MKFSFKGMTIELDHSTFMAILTGVGMYVKAIVIDYKLGKNKDLKSNSMLELAERKIKGDQL